MPLTPAQKRATDPVRSAWKAMPNHKLIPALESRLGKDVTVRVCNSTNRHIKVIGPARTVELYATTGLVNCAPHNNLKPCKFTNMMPSRAIERVATLATQGW
tara:strand:+ start:230 stop:535 length:306 start_codon:yes stop_codon:yes gene_type:complete